MSQAGVGGGCDLWFCPREDVPRDDGETRTPETAKTWLFGTNARLDDQAPIEVLRAAEATEQFTAVVRATRQLASFQT